MNLQVRNSYRRNTFFSITKFWQRELVTRVYYTYFITWNTRFAEKKQQTADLICLTVKGHFLSGTFKINAMPVSKKA
jgi:hypothetical protein